MSITRETLQKLAGFDTPTICNAIELFDLRPWNEGFMDRRIRACFPELPPMVGFAATAAFRTSTVPEGGDAYGTLLGQIESFADLPGAAVIVFEDLDEVPVGATFGEMMCSIYREFGSTGLITSGAGRDLDQVRALDYPIFTESTICSHAYCQILRVGEPVSVGGLAVTQGDLLHGDRNGVTSIPLEIADELADVTKEYMDAEAFILDYLHQPGQSTIEGLSDARAACTEAIGNLKQRLGK